MNWIIIPRKAQRTPVTLAAACRTLSGLRDEGFLSDISTSGCCVATRGIRFTIGARVIIRPQGLEGLAGVIRWIDGNCAGVEFDHPLYGPVVEHLCDRYASAIPANISRYN